MKEMLKKLLFGIHYPEEYLCTPYERLTGKFKVFASFENSTDTAEVSSSHIFLGYKPLIIGIPIEKNDVFHSFFDRSEKICLSFQTTEFSHHAKINGFI